MTLGHKDARPWLYGIATNVLREHAREEVRRKRDVSASDELDDADFERVQARADATARIAATVEALASLEPVDRETLLCALTDLRYEQIAIATCVPVGTVRSRLNRARRLMQAQLGTGEAGASSDAAEEGSGRSPQKSSSSASERHIPRSPSCRMSGSPRCAQRCWR